MVDYLLCYCIRALVPVQRLEHIFFQRMEAIYRAAGDASRTSTKTKEETSGFLVFALLPDPTAAVHATVRNNTQDAEITPPRPIYSLLYYMVTSMEAPWGSSSMAAKDESTVEGVIHSAVFALCSRPRSNKQMHQRTYFSLDLLCSKLRLTYSHQMMGAYRTRRHALQ